MSTEDNERKTEYSHLEHQGEEDGLLPVHREREEQQKSILSLLRLEEGVRLMACWDSKTVKWFSVSASGKSKRLEQMINTLI